jgi:hypothetical protein
MRKDFLILTSALVTLGVALVLALLRPVRFDIATSTCPQAVYSQLISRKQWLPPGFTTYVQIDGRDPSQTLLQSLRQIYGKTLASSARVDALMPRDGREVLFVSMWGKWIPLTNRYKAGTSESCNGTECAEGVEYALEIDGTSCKVLSQERTWVT